MKRKNITIEEARGVWEELKDNEFVLIFYPTFEDYWRECERINNLSDEEWQKLIEENQKRLYNLMSPTQKQGGVYGLGIEIEESNK